MFYQLISILGAVLVLGAFAAHQTKRLSSDTVLYQLLNAVGAALLTTTAIVESQYGVILLEGSWTVISVWGLARLRRGRA